MSIPAIPVEDVDLLRKKRKTRLLLCLSNVTFLIFGLMSYQSAIFSILAFDSPTSTQGWNLLINLILILPFVLFPLMCFLSILFSWGYYFAKKYSAARISAVSPIINIAFYAIVFLICNAYQYSYPIVFCDAAVSIISSKDGASIAKCYNHDHMNEYHYTRYESTNGFMSTYNEDELSHTDIFDEENSYSVKSQSHDIYLSDESVSNYQSGFLSFTKKTFKKFIPYISYDINKSDAVYEKAKNILNENWSIFREIKGIKEVYALSKHDQFGTSMYFKIDLEEEKSATWIMSSINEFFTNESVKGLQEFIDAIFLDTNFHDIISDSYLIHLRLSDLRYVPNPAAPHAILRISLSVSGWEITDNIDREGVKIDFEQKE